MLMKKYVDNNWCSFEGKVATINTDTYTDWLENDAFFANVYNHVRMSEGLPVTMRLVGSDANQVVVLAKLSWIADKLQFGAPKSLEVEITPYVPPWEEPKTVTVNIDDVVVEVELAPMYIGEFNSESLTEALEEPKPEIVTPKKRKK
jgi:hypothetical protein